MYTHWLIFTHKWRSHQKTSGGGRNQSWNGSVRWRERRGMAGGQILWVLWCYSSPSQRYKNPPCICFHHFDTLGSHLVPISYVYSQHRACGIYWAKIQVCIMNLDGYQMNQLLDERFMHATVYFRSKRNETISDIDLWTSVSLRNSAAV